MIAARAQSVYVHRALTAARSVVLCLCVLLTFVACDRKEKPADPTKGVAPSASTESLPLEMVDTKKTLEKQAVSTVVALPKPTEMLAADTTCVTSGCHSTFATANRIHGPVAQQNCMACHMEDQGSHSYPLKRQGDATCTFCHTVTGTASHQHKAIENNGCTTCHNPHIAKTKFLLTADNVDQLCQRCHDIPWQKHAHQPFAAGKCTLCHQPHESNFDHLLRGGNEPEQCFSCHTDKKSALASSISVHKPATQQCSTCHNPHTSPYPAELRAPINDVCLTCHEDIAKKVVSATVSHDAILMSPDFKGGCANCHDAHATQNPKLLKARADELCMTCHNKPVKAHDGHMVADMSPTLKREFQHGPVRSGDCTACHNVHGASHERLLVKTFPKTFYANFDLENYALCFTCHNKELVLEPKTAQLTGFRNGDENLHFVHVNRDEKGRTCKTCHDIHGSDLPNHMATSVPFEGSQWSMPMHFEKKINGGSCAPGCHEPKQYDRTAVLTPQSPSPDSPVPAQGGQP
jgi:predicted CXXCH cytochrome family protein